MGVSDSQKNHGESEADKKFTTQRVDMGTLDLIKSINLHLSRRGIRLRQSELIQTAFLFIKSREWEFIEFVESGGAKKSSGLLNAVFETASRPWFPYGDFRS
jgi:hypothetical protein